MSKEVVKQISINGEIIDLPFPVEIVPYCSGIDSPSGIQNAQTILMCEVIIELIKGFMKKIERLELWK